MNFGKIVHYRFEIVLLKTDKPTKEKQFRFCITNHLRPGPQQNEITSIKIPIALNSCQQTDNGKQFFFFLFRFVYFGQKKVVGNKWRETRRNAKTWNINVESYKKKRFGLFRYVCHGQTGQTRDIINVDFLLFLFFFKTK